MKINNDNIQSNSLIGSTYSMLVADQFGTVGTMSIPTGGGSQNLSQTLAIGDDSGTYSIIMGTSTSIKSSNGGGQIDFYSDEISLTTDNGAYGDSYIDMFEGEIDINAVSTISLSQDNSTSDLHSGLSLSEGQIQLNLTKNVGGASQYGQGIQMLYSGVTASGQTLGLGLVATFINSNNSSFNAGVANSVIIGGSGMTATMSNTVYVPNLVINGTINGVKRYKAIVSQSGTASPTVNKVIENTIGTMTWSRIAQGVFKVTGASGSLLQTNRSFQYGLLKSIDSVNGMFQETDTGYSDDYIEIYGYDVNFNFTYDGFDKILITIEVYP
jgi:hypothetical protein